MNSGLKFEVKDRLYPQRSICGVDTSWLRHVRRFEHLHLHRPSGRLSNTATIFTQHGFCIYQLLGNERYLTPVAGFEACTHTMKVPAGFYDLRKTECFS